MQQLQVAAIKARTHDARRHAKLHQNRQKKAGHYKFNS